MIPFGVPPDVAMRMMRASQVFRIHDRGAHFEFLCFLFIRCPSLTPAEDWTGNLDFHEFALAMASYVVLHAPGVDSLQT